MEGSSVDLLRKIKSALIAEMNTRFANRGVLKRLAWLDLSRWPEDVADVNAFVLPDIEAIFDHWKARFTKRAVTLDALKREFEQIKVVWQTTSKPIEKSHGFWKSIIQNRGVFTQWHYLLRMVLALTPSDAVVEAVFSRLTRILAPQRTLLSTKMVEQLLILAVDTEPWHSYDFTRVVQMLRSNERRAQFRAPRADKGTKKRTYAGKKKATDTSTGDAGDVLMEESDASVDASVGLRAHPLPLMGSSLSDTLHEHGQQVILGYRGQQQVPERRGVLPPNYSQWGLLDQVLVCDLYVGGGHRPPPGGGG